MTAALRFVAYDRLAYNGEPLGELTEAFDKQVLIEWDGEGSGEFKLNRNSEQAAWIRTWNYIRVYLDNVGLADPLIFGFFIGAGEDQLLSQEEEGGENWHRGGKGTAAYLNRGILTATESGTNFFSIDTTLGKWVWTDRKVGTILQDILNEAKLHSVDPFPLLVYPGWSNSTDTAGNPFDDLNGDFSIEIGTHVDEAVTALRAQGLSIRMTANFDLMAYQDYVNPNSGCLFIAEVNIAESGTREIVAKQAYSRVLVSGNRDSGTPVYRSYVEPSVVDEIGAFESYLRYDKTATDARMAKAGNAFLASAKKGAEGPIVLEVIMGDGASTGSFFYVPFVDYRPGDLVNVYLPGEIEGLDLPVDGIVLVEGDNAEVAVGLQLNVGKYDPPSDQTSAVPQV